MFFIAILFFLTTSVSAVWETSVCDWDDYPLGATNGVNFPWSWSRIEGDQANVTAHDVDGSNHSLHLEASMGDWEQVQIDFSEYGPDLGDDSDRVKSITFDVDYDLSSDDPAKSGSTKMYVYSDNIVKMHIHLQLDFRATPSVMTRYLWTSRGPVYHWSPNMGLTGNHTIWINLTNEVGYDDWTITVLDRNDNDAVLWTGTFETRESPCDWYGLGKTVFDLYHTVDRTNYIYFGNLYVSGENILFGSAPVLSDPIPANESVNLSTLLSTWNITIEDPDSDTFDYSIECSNGDSVSDTDVTNDTFTLNLVSGFTPGDTYTVWVNVTDQKGKSTKETFWFHIEGKTMVDYFLIKTEQGANVGWDLDNNNVTLDITFHDAEGDTTWLYFTFNKGSQARLPTTGDYDAVYDGGVNATITDLDLTWTDGSWSDYDGIVYVRVVGWDEADYTEDLTYSTLANGIDGTTPSSNVDEILGYNRSYSPLIITATATDSPSIATIYNVTLYYSYSEDNISFSGWTLFQTDYSSPYSWKFTFPDGRGWYKFGTRALDLAGNLEAQVTDDTIFFTAAFEHESGTDLVERGLGVGVGDLILFVLTCSFIIVAAVDVRIAAMFATLLYSVLFVIYFEATAAGITGYDPVRAGICVAISIVVLALLLLAAGKAKSRMGYIP